MPDIQSKKERNAAPLPPAEPGVPAENPAAQNIAKTEKTNKTNKQIGRAHV